MYSIAVSFTTETSNFYFAPWSPLTPVLDYLFASSATFSLMFFSLDAILIKPKRWYLLLISPTPFRNSCPAYVHTACDRITCQATERRFLVKKEERDVE